MIELELVRFEWVVNPGSNMCFEQMIAQSFEIDAPFERLHAGIDADLMQGLGYDEQNFFTCFIAGIRSKREFEWNALAADHFIADPIAIMVLPIERIEYLLRPGGIVVDDRQIV